jgi:hypothetical protein
MTPRSHRAMLGMVPIAVLVASLNVAVWLTSRLGLPQGLGVLLAFLLATAGYFVSRAILRRGFARWEAS